MSRGKIWMSIMEVKNTFPRRRVIYGLRHGCATEPQEVRAGRR